MKQSPSTELFSILKRFVTCCVIYFIPVYTIGAEFQIYRSTEMDDETFANEIKSKVTISKLETDLRLARQRQSAIRLEGLRSHYRRGEISKVHFDRIEKDHFAVETKFTVEKNYEEFVRLLKSRISTAIIVDPPTEPEELDPEFQVRVPGLTLRTGGVDLFTVRMKAKASTTYATKKYTATVLKQGREVPHKHVVQDFVEDRLSKLSSLSTQRETEIDRTKFFVSALKHIRLLSDHKFAARWRQGQRIEQYNNYVNEQPVSQSQPRPLQTFAGSQDSFWLFGDGEAVADPSANLSTPDIYIAELKAKSNQAVLAAKGVQQSHQLQYSRLLKLKSKGVARQSEVREAKLALDIANLGLKKAKAQKKVAEAEFAQLKAAVSTEADFSRPISLPEANGLSSHSANTWVAWLVDGPTVKTNEILRFFDLLRDRFIAASNTKIAHRVRQIEQARMNDYGRVSSVYQKELELQQERVNLSRIGYNNALERESLAKFKIQQWAHRNYKIKGVETHPAPETLVNIMEAGKVVNSAQVEVAKLDLDQKKARYQYDIDYLKRLKEIKRKGAASAYEVSIAHNQVLKSKGMLHTLAKKIAIVQQQAKFLKALYESGSMSYDENGLEISRFMPEATVELQKLAMLRNSVDEGKVLVFEAQLADNLSRIAELNRLVKKGFASPVEVEIETVRKRQIESRLLAEKGRGGALKYALDVVNSLEFEPEIHQTIEPPEQLSSLEEEPEKFQRIEPSDQLIL